MIKSLKKALKELHEIRQNHYEETMTLTPKERVELIKLEADKIIRKYGLRFKKHHAAV